MNDWAHRHLRPSAAVSPRSVSQFSSVNDRWKPNQRDSVKMPLLHFQWPQRERGVAQLRSTWLENVFLAWLGKLCLVYNQCTWQGSYRSSLPGMYWWWWWNNKTRANYYFVLSCRESINTMEKQLLSRRLTSWATCDHKRFKWENLRFASMEWSVPSLHF